METTVVAVYDHQNEVVNARNALLDAGFSGKDIRLNMNPDETDSESQETHGIAHFFRTMFGWDETNHAHDMYAEAIRRGSYVLVVDVYGDEDRERAIRVLSRFDPVDIDERASYWTDQGWQGYDVSAPRLSQEEIRHDRSLYERNTPSALTGGLPGGGYKMARDGEAAMGRTSGAPAAGSRVATPGVATPGLRGSRAGTVTARHTPAAQSGADEIPRQTGNVRVFRRPPVAGQEPASPSLPPQTHAPAQDPHPDARAAVHEDDAAAYRAHWQSAYGASGAYEEFDSAYRYGSALGGAEPTGSFRWDEVEPDLRRGWEAQHPDSAWDKVKDAVRYGVERVRDGLRH